MPSRQTIPCETVWDGRPAIEFVFICWCFFFWLVSLSSLSIEHPVASIFSQKIKTWRLSPRQCSSAGTPSPPALVPVSYHIFYQMFYHVFLSCLSSCVLLLLLLLLTINIIINIINTISISRDASTFKNPQITPKNALPMRFWAPGFASSPDLLPDSHPQSLGQAPSQTWHSGHSKMTNPKLWDSEIWWNLMTFAITIGCTSYNAKGRSVSRGIQRLPWKSWIATEVNERLKILLLNSAGNNC